MSAISQLTQTRLCNQLESAAAVFLSPHHRFDSSPTDLARLRRVDRSTIYRRATSLQTKLERLHQAEALISSLRAQNDALQEQVSALQQEILPYTTGFWVQVTPEKLALTTLEMAARHNSASDIQSILKTAFQLPKPPSDGTICNIIKQGSRLADQILNRVQYHFPLDAIEFDELFHAQSPILAALEPYSMSLVMLHQLGDCKTSTWKFGFDFLDVELPPLMVHDCSMQGNALVRLLGKTSQLCVWHRLREIGRELRPQLDNIYKQSLQDEDELRWQRAEELESCFGTLANLTHSLDPYRRTVRRFEPAQQELLDWCREFGYQLDRLGLKCPSLSGLELRVHQYLAHLRQWDRLSQEVELIREYDDFEGFDLIDALAAVHISEEMLADVYKKHGESRAYREEQSLFLECCERLRDAQSRVQNASAIEEKFKLLVGNQVRTSSRVEALNRRLRGFTDAKRQVTERQLLLMQLHHNTTHFSSDAKRAGKSPWEWLALDVSGLEGGFVGVLKAASREAGMVWPSMWSLKP